MKPGVTNLPAPSMTVAPGGTVTEARGPTAVMRLPVMTIGRSAIGGPPLPSMIVAPTTAVDAAACDAAVERCAEATAARAMARRARADWCLVMVLSLMLAALLDAAGLSSVLARFRPSLAFGGSRLTRAAGAGIQATSAARRALRARR